MCRAPRMVSVAAGLAAAIAATATAQALTPAKIRTGGPSAPGDPKIAIVGTDRNLAGRRYVVLDNGGRVAAGKLRRVRGTPAPWRHAYAAPLTGAGSPGRFRVKVPALGRTSRPWVVRPGGSGGAIDTILDFFAWNADGR